ncbi:CRAL-TRIO domain-containing protein [Meloidogyne graminicola]|uniref:CRAL-TRIO domain-containing protein n=1 Tax=Meloidogyne graminicola TaxID=189291 RepID=A0A8S9ZHZ7_9BILA|nr:CRAL-TRIO domain-containing protein [Meloidogyne graminicola]
MPKSKINSASLLKEQKPECGSSQQEQLLLNISSKSPTKRSIKSEDFCRPPNESELCQLNDLRKILAPQLAKNTNKGDVEDDYLLRWLRSKEGRFDETADGVKKDLVFRKAWGLDKIANWTAPEILEKYCGYGFLADRSGNPILMSLLGNMDVEGMLRSVQSKDYIKFSLAAIEKGITLCRQRAQISGLAFEQMMLVFDLDHITSAHYSSKQFASSFTTLIMLFQEPPEMARIAFNSMTPFFSEATQKLIEIPSEEDWKKALSEHVDLDAWPVHWGGRMCENGDPKCPSKVRYGLGPVPDSYYVDQATAMPDYDQLTTVWQYMTEEEDIGFAVYFDSSGTANNLAEMECVYPYIRLECSLVPISGSLLCEQDGRYIIEFDNYYSWFSAKQLRYNIEIDDRGV